MKAIFPAAVLLVSSFANAQALNRGAGDEMIPYIAPRDCHASATLIPSSTGVIFSKHCDYAFVLPPKTGTATFSSFAPSANIMSCQAVLDNNETIRRYQKIQKKIADKIDALLTNNPSDPQITKLTEESKSIRETVTDLQKTFANIEGGRVQVIFDGTTSEAMMAEWREANHQLSELQGTVITRAPIHEGYISFDQIDASAESKIIDPTVLKTTVPGFKAPNVQTGTVAMGGAIGGGMVLSLSGVCGLIPEVDFATPAKAKLDSSRVANNLTANYTYSVPVQTGVEYTVTVNVANAIKAMQSQSISSRQFSVQNLINQHLSGSSGEICRVDFKRYELENNDPLATNQFQEQMNGTICTTMISRLLARMQTKGFVKFLEDQAGSGATPVAGGNVAEVHTRRECSSSSFLGITYDSSCGDVQYTVQRWEDGFSAKDIYASDETSYFEGETVKLDSILYRWNTMPFVAVSAQ